MSTLLTGVLRCTPVRQRNVDMWPSPESLCVMAVLRILVFSTISGGVFVLLL